MQVYVELDVLLDTRLGTLQTLNPEFATSAISGGRYYNRLCDNFWDYIPGLTKEAYNQAYTWRTMETIRNSKQTQIYKLINDAVFAEYDKYMRNITDELPRVVVNIYPYDYTEEFAKALTHVLTAIIVTPDIRVIRTNPEELPPWKIGKSYTHLWMYDFDTYFRPFYRELGDYPGIPGVFHFPGIARGVGAETASAGLLGDAFCQHMQCLAGFVNVSFEPAYNYSFHLHSTPPKEDGEVRQETREQEEVAVRLDQSYQ